MKRNLKKEQDDIFEGNSIYVEDINNVDESVFRDFYYSAVDKIERIVELYQNEEKLERISKYNEYPNNIISFVGERGSGKTSMMLTVAEIKKEEAYVLELIEPELIENEINLLEVVVSRMYSNFKKKYLKFEIKKSYDEEIRELNLKFLEIIKSIKVYFERRENYNYKESSENLLEVSNALKLKEKFKELIEVYIKNMNILNKKNFKYVIIIIDDMDLNFKNTYSVLEQLRKFLIIPNLINMIAYKERQLIDVLESKFVGSEKIEAAEKYLKKLFPYENKLYTPTKEDVLFSLSEDLEEKFKEKIFKNINIDDEILQEFYPETLRESVALKKFLREYKVDINNYIDFLGEKYLFEINKLKKNKQYLKTLLEIDKLMRTEDLSVDDLKILYLKKEYILKMSTKKKKIAGNMLRSLPEIEIVYEWGKDSVIKKDRVQVVNKKAIDILKKEVKLLTEREKIELSKFVEFLFEDNKVNIFNIFKGYELNFSILDMYNYIQKVDKIIENRHCKSINEFLQILDIENKNELNSSISFCINVIKKNQLLKRVFELVLFLPNRYYSELEFNSVYEIESIFSNILEAKQYYLYINEVLDMKSEKEYIEYIEDIRTNILDIINCIPNLKKETEKYIKLINEALLSIKMNFLELDIKNDKKIKNNIFEKNYLRVSNLSEKIRELLIIDLEKLNINLPESFIVDLEMIEE